MEKIKVKVGQRIDSTVLLDKQNEIIEEIKHLWVNLIDLQKEMLKIVDWIKEHEKYVQPLEKAWKEAIEQTLEQAKKKQEPKNIIAGKLKIMIVKADKEENYPLTSHDFLEGFKAACREILVGVGA